MNAESKLNPERKAEWVAALRSGNYKQGKSCLRNNRDEFCCLGVASDLAVLDNSAEWARPDYDQLLWDAQAPGGKTFGSHYTLCRAVARWLGLPDVVRDPEFTENGERFRLSDLNDGGASFEEIADIIEREF